MPANQHNYRRRPRNRHRREKFDDNKDQIKAIQNCLDIRLKQVKRYQHDSLAKQGKFLVDRLNECRELSDNKEDKRRNYDSNQTDELSENSDVSGFSKKDEGITAATAGSISSSNEYALSSNFIKYFSLFIDKVPNYIRLEGLKSDIKSERYYNENCYVSKFLEYGFKSTSSPSPENDEDSEYPYFLINTSASAYKQSKFYYIFFDIKEIIEAVYVIVNLEYQNCENFYNLDDRDRERDRGDRDLFRETQTPPFNNSTFTPNNFIHNKSQLIDYNLKKIKEEILSKLENNIFDNFKNYFAQLQISDKNTTSTSNKKIIFKIIMKIIILTAVYYKCLGQLDMQMSEKFKKDMNGLDGIGLDEGSTDCKVPICLKMMLLELNLYNLSFHHDEQKDNRHQLKATNLSGNFFQHQNQNFNQNQPNHQLGWTMFQNSPTTMGSGSPFANSHSNSYKDLQGINIWQGHTNTQAAGNVDNLNNLNSNFQNLSIAASSPTPETTALDDSKSESRPNSQCSSRSQKHADIFNLPSILTSFLNFYQYKSDILLNMLKFNSQYLGVEVIEELYKTVEKLYLKLKEENDGSKFTFEFCKNFLFFVEIILEKIGDRDLVALSFKSRNYWLG